MSSPSRQSPKPNSPDNLVFSELLISGHLLRVEEDEVGKDAPLGDGGQVLPQLRAGGLGVGNASVDRPRRLSHRGLGGPLLN